MRAAICLLALLATPALAEPLVREHRNPYTVTGATAAEIRADINRRGMRDTRGVPGDAITYWHVEWNASIDAAPQGCTVKAVTVFLTLSTVSPELAPDAAAPPDVRARFDAYLVRLLAHEAGHREIAIAGAAEIEAALSALPPDPSCSQLRSASDARGRAIVQEIIRRQDAYDDRTQNGYGAGVAFP